MTNIHHRQKTKLRRRNKSETNIHHHEMNWLLCTLGTRDVEVEFRKGTRNKPTELAYLASTTTSHDSLNDAQ